MKKRILALSLGLVLALALCACGDTTTETADPQEETQQEAAEPLDLTGQWEMTTGTSDEAFMTATISGDEIEVLWVTDSGNALYWAGTYAAPTEATDSYTWTSEASDRNASALLASGDSTKDFTYANETLSFSVSVNEVTVTIEMQRTGDVVAETTEATEQADTAQALGTEVDLGQYVVSIDSASLTTDDEGNNVIVVAYTWTNNSEDSQMASVALMQQAYQDGIQIDTAFLYGSDYDFDAANKNIRPGITQSVVCAFILENTDSPVEVEISDWTDFTGNEMAAYTFDLAEL